MHADIHMIIGVEWLKCEINLITADDIHMIVGLFFTFDFDCLIADDDTSSTQTWKSSLT